jgi:hypothetical protein
VVTDTHSVVIEHRCDVRIHYITGTHGHCIVVVVVVTRGTSDWWFGSSVVG